MCNDSFKRWKDDDNNNKIERKKEERFVPPLLDGPLPIKLFDSVYSSI